MPFKKYSFLLVSIISVISIFLCSCSNKSDNSLGSSEFSLESSNSDSYIEPFVTSSALIGNMGDLLIHSPILSACYYSDTDSYNFDNIFTYIKPYIQELDYCAVDLEGSLAGSGYSGYPTFRCPDSLIDSAKNAGFDLFLIANNHSNDGLSQGFIRTMQVLSNKNVDYIGSRDNYNSKII